MQGVSLEELRKGDFHERYITSKWYPDLQENKFAGPLIQAYLRSGKSSRGSMPELFSLYEDS